MFNNQSNLIPNVKLSSFLSSSLILFKTDEISLFKMVVESVVFFGGLYPKHKLFVKSTKKGWFTVEKEIPQHIKNRTKKIN